MSTVMIARTSTSKATSNQRQGLKDMGLTGNSWPLIIDFIKLSDFRRYES